MVWIGLGTSLMPLRVFEPLTKRLLKCLDEIAYPFKKPFPKPECVGWFVACSNHDVHVCFIQSNLWSL